MQPRRNVFGESFILETVSYFSHAVNLPKYCREEMRWAADVLEKYFEVVSDTPTIRRSLEEYSEAKSKMNIGGDFGVGNWAPYPLSTCIQHNVSFDQLHALFLSRRSVRWYESRDVPGDLIQRAIHIASLAPSACNRQPYRFIVSKGCKHAVSIVSCAGGAAGFAHQVPAAVVVVGDLSAFSEEKDRHLIYVDASLASMQLMLALQTVGLSTCSINWPDAEHADRKLRRVVDYRDHERVIMLISIGYGDPEGGIPFSQKKPHGVLTSNPGLK